MESFKRDTQNPVFKENIDYYLNIIFAVDMPQTASQILLALPPTPESGCLRSGFTRSLRNTTSVSLTFDENRERLILTLRLCFDLTLKRDVIFITNDL